jgi:hypothetical protein
MLNAMIITVQINPMYLKIQKRSVCLERRPVYNWNFMSQAHLNAVSSRIQGDDDAFAHESGHIGKEKK